tara:strand:- start:714 stop:884 length:171 start_codon:yes stop_codon:yes gene_type:complete
MELYELSIEWLIMVIQDAVITAFIYIAGFCVVAGILISSLYKRYNEIFSTKPPEKR